MSRVSCPLGSLVWTDISSSYLLKRGETSRCSAGCLTCSALFPLRTREMFVCVFRLLGLWHGRDSEDLSPSGVPEEVRLTCTQFVRYHKDQCVQDIVHTRRYERWFVCVFSVFVSIKQYVSCSCVLKGLDLSFFCIFCLLY